MSSILLIISCLGLGVLVGRMSRPPPGLAQGLNWWVLNIAFSALVLHLVPSLEFHWDFWFLVASMWIVFVGAWLFFAMLGKRLQWSRARIGALTLVGGLGNTSFIGFPLIEALRGTEGLRLAVIADQAGCFVALGVGGTLVSALYSGKTVSPLSIARRVLTFPPFVCLWIGVLVGSLGHWPAIVDETFARIGATLVPLALFSVGLQLRLRPGEGQGLPMMLGLTWKMVLAPAVVFLIALVTNVGTDVRTIAVLEAAMAPMISAAILAEQNNLEGDLANMTLGLGILLSFISVPLVNLLLA